MLVQMPLAELALARALNSARNRRVMMRIVFMAAPIKSVGWTNSAWADHWAVQHPLAMRNTATLADIDNAKAQWNGFWR